ncbi:MAG TPA: glycosyltransferase family 2 protein, partial [Gemmata sp.]|nr:glycosyltransferase family 2 protein [Gemmata sp.]
MDCLSLVIPAFNEAAVIARAIAEAEEALGQCFLAFEVIVVDDGSSDPTASVVKKALSTAKHTRLIRHESNRGYGAALRTGFEAARFPLVAFTDADCQFDLNELPSLAVLAAEYPIVAGYRVDRKDSCTRRFYSWGYNRLARVLLGTRVRDVDCALKVFRREVLTQLLPDSRGFFVNTEILTRARQLGFPVVEVPVSHRPRASGESKVSIREIPRTAARLVRFWWSNVVMAPKSAPATPVVLQSRVVIPRDA